MNPLTSAPATLTPQAAATTAEALFDRVESLVTPVDAQAWARPVPACPGWDVHDLVGHIAGFTTMFAGLPQPQPPEGWTPPEGSNPIDSVTEANAAARRAWSPDAVLEELRTARRTWPAQLRALPDLTGETMGPLGPTTQAGFASVRFFDLWCHLYDLHDALGVPFDPAADELAGQWCYAYILSRAPWLYGKRGGAPEGASVRLDLHGPPLEVHTGITVRDGRAVWDDQPWDRADDLIAGPTAAFALLVTGRMDRARAQALGLSGSGPEAERLLTVRMFG